MTHLSHRHAGIALLVTLVRLTFSRVQLIPTTMTLCVCVRVCVCVCVWCVWGGGWVCVCECVCECVWVCGWGVGGVCVCMCVWVCVCVCVRVCGQYKLLHSNKLSQLSNFVSSPRVHCVTILYSSYETSTNLQLSSGLVQGSE